MPNGPDERHNALYTYIAAASGKPKEKTEKEVQVEIREIMKQITASVTFLPVLEEECEWCDIDTDAVRSLRSCSVVCSYSFLFLPGFV
jgi:hypothetical protein